MRVISAFLALCLVCGSFINGQPIEKNNDLETYENERTENGYRFYYVTADGQAREEVGTIDPSTGVLTVTGWYSYLTPDGATYRVDYVADENGYRIVDQPGVVVPEVAIVAAAPINNALLLSLVG